MIFPKENKDTHASSYGVVYANDAAREDMAVKSPQSYRPGAIIVRGLAGWPEGEEPVVGREAIIQSFQAGRGLKRTSIESLTTSVFLYLSM